jgi:pimeloyl-ACP methyl ester carboxylesterase
MVHADSFHSDSLYSGVSQKGRRNAAPPKAAENHHSAVSSMVIETPTAQVSFFEAGKDSSLPALVLLPGLFCSAQRFLTAMLPLSEHTKVVAVEWRGHGVSTASAGCQVKDLASDVIAVIRTRLQGSKVCLFGHSMGARVIWSMLESYGSELSGTLHSIAIIDQGPTASTGKASAGRADHAYETYKRDAQQIRLGQKQMMEVLKRIWAYSNSGFVHSQAALAEWMAFASECNPVVGSSLYWDALSTDYSRIVKSMSVNTNVLLMVGDSTLGPSDIYNRMGAAIPPHGAHFALFKGGTHCPHLQSEHVTEMSRLVAQLLQKRLERNATPGNLGGAAKSGSTRASPMQNALLTQAPLLQSAKGNMGPFKAAMLSTRLAPATGVPMHRRFMGA